MILLTSALIGAPAGWLVLRARERAEALERIETAYERRALPGALRLALAYLHEHPNDRDAALWAARCFSRLNQAANAEPYYQKAGPLELDDQHLRALGLVTGDFREEAVAAFEAILDERPDDILALRRLAAVRIAQNRPRDALKLADRLIVVPGGAVIGYSLKGVVHHDLREPDLAVPAFEQVLKRDPDLLEMPLEPSAMFWAYLGQDLLTLGRIEETRHWMERALELEGRDASILNLLGMAHQQLGDVDEAERCWRTATQWNPGLASPLLNLGRLALRRGDVDEALRRLRRAHELAPNAEEVLYNLSLAHRRKGNVEEADRMLEKYEQIKK